MAKHKLFIDIQFREMDGWIVGQIGVLGGELVPVASLLTQQAREHPETYEQFKQLVLDISERATKKYCEKRGWEIGSIGTVEIKPGEEN